MCDFHSVVIRIDGAIAHVPGNSHSAAVAAAKWTENNHDPALVKPRFYEWEWHGNGEIPSVRALLKNIDITHVPEKVLRVAVTHAEALKRVLTGLRIEAPFDQDDYSDVRERLAQNTATPADTLAVLAKDSSDDVRSWVAQNTATPADTLAVLAKDSIDDVRSGVARNTATPADTLAVLAKDSSADVRSWVARNTATPADTLAVLAKDSSTNVRSGVARNTATPADIRAIALT